jgi:hypothetical protein
MEFGSILRGPGGWPSAPPSLGFDVGGVSLWSQTTRPPRSDMKGVLGRVVWLQSRPGICWGDDGADGQASVHKSKQAVHG